MNSTSLIQSRGLRWLLPVGLATLLTGQSGWAAANQVIAWGSNSAGQTAVPPAITNAMVIAAGGTHSLALLSNGKIVAWGSNTYGQTNVPSTATNVIAIAAGGESGYAVRTDGKVIAWGRNSNGQTSVPTAATNASAIAAGPTHVMALRRDGTIVAWGDSSNGKTIARKSVLPYTGIAVGAQHNLALRADGSVFAWGAGAVYSPDAPNFGQSVVPKEATNIVAIAAGAYHSLALRMDGTVLAWGYNANGQTDVPPWATNVIAISANSNYSLALRSDGSIVGWGDVPSNMPTDLDVVAVAAGANHAIAIISDGSPWIAAVTPDTVTSGCQVLPLTVRAVGRQPVSFQWFTNGVAALGATSPYPQLQAPAGVDAVACQVVVSNALGALTSAVSRVTVRTVLAWGANIAGQCNVPFVATNPSAIAAGEHHGLIVNPDGRVVAWGKNRDGQTNVPATATNVIAVAAGGDHSLALRGDGTVIGWGGNSNRQTDAPVGATNVVGISAGRAHSLALRADGSVVAWGDDECGQWQACLLAVDAIAIASGYWHNMVLRSDGTVTTSALDYAVPREATNVVAIAAGWESCLALRSDGSVVAWGDNSCGQCDVPSAASNVVTIAAGYYHNVAVRADGSTVVWGRQYRGTSATSVGLRNVARIAAGEEFTIASTAWGPPRFGRQLRAVAAREGRKAVMVSNVEGATPITLQWFHDGTAIPGATNCFVLLDAVQSSHAGDYTVTASNALGQASSDAIALVVKPGAAPASGVVGWRQAPYSHAYSSSSGYPSTCAFSAGGSHVLALNADGTVTAWGKNWDGQIDVPPAATNVVAVAAGGDHSLALRDDGAVIAWGRNWDGQTEVPWLATNVIAIAAGLAHSLALRSDGTVVAWGNNDCGQTDVSFLATEVKAIAAGYYHSAALRSDGRVVTWGLDYAAPQSATNIVAIAAGWQHCLALRADGSVVAWGNNALGQCNVPEAATNIVAIAAGYYADMALRADGSLITWGIQTAELTGAPESLTDVAAIASGEDYSLVLVGAGPPRLGRQLNTVVANLGGRSGIAANVAGASPLGLQWFHDGVAVVGATNQFLELRNVGLTDVGEYTLQASNAYGSAVSQPVVLSVQDLPATITTVGGWGDNHLGQLSVSHSAISPRAVSAGAYHGLALNADGTVVAWGKNVDGQVTNVPPQLAGVVAIAAGGDHCLALTDEGSVVGWGRNWDGQASPPPEASSNVVAIAAGWAHSLALRADGTVLAWGNNDYAQTNVSFLARDVIAIAAGYYHSLALRSDHTLAAWGTLQPVPASATNVIAMAGGWDHSLALRADGTVIAWGGNAYGQCLVPASATNIVAVAAGYGHSLAQRADGTVIAWGKDYYGVTNIPSGLGNVAAIACGEDHDLALVQFGPPQFSAPDTIVKHAGATALLTASVAGTQPLIGQWAHNGVPIPGATRPTLQLTNVQSADAGTYVLAVTNAAGQANSATISLIVLASPELATRFSRTNVIPGSPFCLSAEVTGTLPISYRWQRNGADLSDGGTLSDTTVPALCVSAAVFTDSGDYGLVLSNAYGMVTGVVARVAVTPVIAWGDNSVGQLDVPAEATSVVALASREDHNLALLADGSVVAWGDNTYGQNNVPAAAVNVVAIAEGTYHSLALRRDGTVVAWGGNSDGQINVPASATDIIAIAAGITHSYGIRRDGTPLAWGKVSSLTVPATATNVIAVSCEDGPFDNRFLRSDGSAVTTFLPALANCVAIAAGTAHTLALQTNGTMLATGSLRYGLPSFPAPATNIVAVAAGGDHSLALRADGALFSWGDDTYGESEPPVWANNVVSIAAGGVHSLALIGDGKPRFTINPLAPIAATGTTVRLAAVAAGQGALSYQWQFNGADLPGATRAVLWLPNLQWPQTGRYRLVASNALGVTYSAEAVVTLTGSPLVLEGSVAAMATNGGFLVRFLDLSGQNSVVLYGSTNLANWEALLTNSPSLTPVEYLDPLSTNAPLRFYRLGTRP